MSNCISKALTRQLLSVAAAATVAMAPALAADDVMPSLVIGEVQVKPPGRDYQILNPDTPFPAGSDLRTGADGEVTFDFSAGSRAIVQQDSEMTLAGVRGQTTRNAPVAFTTRGSAIKAILTESDAKPVLSETFLPAADLVLRRGSLFSVVENSRQRIDLPVGFVYGTSAGFVTTVESPTTIRVTVHDGFATLGLPDGRTIPVKAGEYVRLTKTRSDSGYKLTGPAPVDQDALALADMAQFDGHGGKKGLLEPVAEFIADPAVPMGEGVGTGLSAPFDLASTRAVVRASTRAVALGAPPNPANLLPPVISRVDPPE